MISLHGKTFRVLSNTENGEVSGDTLFHYFQQGNCIWANYSGGEIERGHLLGHWVNGESIYFSYHHINANGELLTGICWSYPSIDSEGKIILREQWQWTCRDSSKGESMLIEVMSPQENS